MRFHDIGKIGKVLGQYDLLALPGARVLCNVIRHHHERLDGSGYPEGLKGEAISLEGRIVAVADVFDAVVQQQADAGRLDGDCVAELEQVLVAAAVSSDAGDDAIGDVMFSVDALRLVAN